MKELYFFLIVNTLIDTLQKLALKWQKNIITTKLYKYTVTIR